MTTRYTPPSSVARSAAAGLELVKRFGRGDTTAGIASIKARATSLANGHSVSLDTLKRMDRYFEQNAGAFQPSIRKSDEGPDAATINWMLWGGDAGRDWVAKTLGQEPEADDSAHRIDVKVEKVDSQLGIVFGYAIVCKVDGEEYFDTQGDHIPETAMLEATADYMSGERMAKVMHRGGSAGQVVYGFPMTEDIAKAMGFEVRKTGFVIGMRPDSDEVLEKFASGEFTGFSIGGRRIEEEVIE